MKRSYLLFAVVCVIMLGLSGCGSENGNRPLPIPATFEYEESTLGNVHIARTTEDLLQKNDSMHKYIHDLDGDMVMLRVDKAVKDFAFVSVNYEETEAGFRLFAEDILFSLAELTPEKPFVVKMLEQGGVLPVYGISFTEENGTKQFYTIGSSGRGIEEAPPYYLMDENEDAS